MGGAIAEHKLVLPYNEEEVVLCRRLCRGLRLGYVAEIRWGRASWPGLGAPGAARCWDPGSARQGSAAENGCYIITQLRPDHPRRASQGPSGSPLGAFVTIDIFENWHCPGLGAARPKPKIQNQLTADWLTCRKSYYLESVWANKGFQMRYGTGPWDVVCRR